MTKHPVLNIETLLEHNAPALRSKAGHDLVLKAYQTADQLHEGQKRASGEPYVQHCLAVASILTELGLDAPTIAAGLLHDVLEDTSYTRDQMEKAFGKEVLSLVEGVTKLGQFDNLNSEAARSYDERELESLRKMFLAMAIDLRVIIVKLADRLHNMRTMDYMKREKQLKISSETVWVYAPLAHRMGLYNIKTEMEDLAMKYMEPDTYKYIAQKLSDTKRERTKYINDFIRPLKEKLEKSGFNFEIYGRPKSIHSIWTKMKKKRREF